jgi:outer membrane protein, multidrug efflux system
MTSSNLTANTATGAGDPRRAGVSLRAGNSRRGGPQRRPLAVTLFIAATLAGCAVGPNYKKPETPVAATYGAAEPALYTSEQAQVQFWKQFGDETLDKLVDDSLNANHDLRIAVGRLAEARAARHQSLYDLAPTVTAAGGHTTQKFPQAQTGFPFTASYYDVGFDATWELDLFGRVRRGVEASKDQLQGAEANLHDAQVSVIAEVARTYFELRGQQNELAVAKRNVENQQSTFQLTDARLKAGRGTEFDTSRASSQLSTTLATIDPLEAAVQRSIHRLSVLTGRDPNALQGLLSPMQNMPELPKTLAVGDPGAMLRRRPDIRVAERQLASASAEIGVAVGDYFPKVTFTGSFGYDAQTLNGLGTSASKAYSIGPGISWAAFDLGRVHARVAGAKARNSTALAQYEQTVLKALEETENALVTHARARDQLVHAADAAQSSAAAAQLARVRYEGGIVDFLEVLDAERTQLVAEDQLAQTRTDTATSLIAVYKALGGGWEGAPFPRYTQASN